MSGAQFNAVDLSRVPLPAIVEPLAYEAIYSELVGVLRGLDPAYTAMVDSDPVAKLLQVAAYRELTLRQRINDAARGCMLPTATGPDLDNLAALFGVARLTLQQAVPAEQIPELRESDVDFRRRIVLATEGYTVAGPSGAYIYHALSAHPDVLDASVASPGPGRVAVTILSRQGDGAPTAALIAAVQAALSADDVRPLTDQVSVVAPTIVPYAVTAALTVSEGPDSAVVLATAQASLAAYLATARRLGRDINRSALFRALHVEGVHNVALAAPAADLVLPPTHAPNCTAINVAIAGTGA